MGVQQEKATIDLVINGKQSEASLKNITTAAVSAKKALDHMAQTDPGYKQQLALWEKLATAQKERIVRINQEKTAWEKFKAGTGSILSGVVGGNLATTGLSALVSLIPAITEHSLKLKDSFADIAKATDMTDSEVKDLNDDLKKIDTRTPTEELRNMVVVAGQFGVAKKDLEGFVESTDMLNVALGDQFDSAEKVAETTLTLRNTFQDIKSDNIGEDMLHIGNALNYLEAQGAATAPVMADFSSRIGGVAIPLGLTSGQVLGLSATLQELNVTSERGSSAITDILTGMTKAPESFAKYAVGVDGAKLSTKDFKDLLNTDLMGALMAVIRGFKEGDTSATGMAAKMADMDLKGNGVMEIFMKLASNTALLTERVNQGSEALTNSTSITNEFSKKNHDLAVNLKKLGEWFDSFLESDVLGRFAGGLVSITVKILGLNNASATATKNYSEQRAKVEDLTSKMTPLIERYDQLTKKSKLSSDEQIELKKITAQIASGMPTAITQFDQYGKAIDISTGRVRQLIAAQKEMQAQMKAGAKEEQELQLRSLEWQKNQLLKKLKSGESVTVSASGNATATPLSKDDIAATQKELDGIYIKQQNALRAMKEIEGITSTADRRKARRESEGVKPKQNAAFGTAESEAEKKAREKKEKEQDRQNKKEIKTAEKHEDDYARLLSESRQRTATAEGDQFTKDQLAFGEHYSKLFELAGGNKEKMEEVSALMYKELAAIEEKEFQRKFKAEQKRQKELLDAAQKELEVKKKLALAEIQLKVASGSMTKDQGKEAELSVEATFLDAKQLLYDSHYKALSDMATGHAEQMDEIKTAQAESQAAIEASVTQNEADQTTARAEARAQDVKNDEEATQKKQQQALRDKEVRKQIMGDLVVMLTNDWAGTIQGYKDYWKQASVIQKAALIASKAWALAEIGINLSRQISLVNTAATVMDAVVPFSGEAFRIKGLAIAIGTAALQTAKVLATNIQAPAFAEGGFTGEQPAGFTSGPTYYAKKNFIAGEKGQEWIMSAPMLQNPVMANLAGALQALQVSGGYKNLSFGSDGALPGPASSGGMSNEVGLAIISQLQQSNQQLLENNQKMEDISKRPVNYNYFKVRDKQDEIDEISTETTL